MKGGINMKRIVMIVAVLLVGVAIAMVIMRREGFMLGPDTDVMNACHDLKYQDILDKFNGDEEMLKHVLYISAHCPKNIPLGDDNYAGLMATYLSNYDPCVYNFGSECKLPHMQQ